jgi:hypothetical protein
MVIANTPEKFVLSGDWLAPKTVRVDFLSHIINKR